MEARSRKQKKCSHYLTLSIVHINNGDSHSQSISFIEIKNLFNKYLDIPINDNDIHDFISDIDLDNDGKISKEELLAALNYDFNKQ